jgi:hypothetical protein
MTTLALFGGPIKSTIIDRAYGMCGQSATAGEACTPEEYVVGLSAMNDLAATFPDAFTFNIPPHGIGNAADESGLALSDVLGFTAMLAREIAQTMGKEFRPNASQTRAMVTLTTKYQTVPLTQLGRNTIRGAGNRIWTGPYFIADPSDAEVIQ